MRGTRRVFRMWKRVHWVSRYFFEHGDITDSSRVSGSIFEKCSIDTVIHFAAESHVDRSSIESEAFIRAGDVMGTFTLLEAARKFWKNDDGSLRTMCSSIT